jgi:IS30 family transposase
VYQQAKHENTKSAGKLLPLKPPNGAWHEVTMDFIEGLPKSDGYDIILLVVDRLTKYAHFIPLKHPFTAAQVASAFLDNVAKIHAVPHSIILDRGHVFTSAFWHALFHAVGTQLHYSTAYHPQTDGQTECINQCLEMYLCCIVHECPKK